jgi:hypothetical protein
VAYNAALDFFSAKDEDTNWIIPVVVNISNELRLVAGLVSIKYNCFPIVVQLHAFFDNCSAEKLLVLFSLT